MYVPEHFKEDRPEVLHRLIRENAFGTLVSNTPEGLFATHIPFILDDRRNVLIGHVARANPHWRSLEGQEALAMFQGPHAYISPRWYATPVAVPSWNYVAVHAYGRPTLVQDGPRLLEILTETVRTFDATWDMPAGEYIPNLARNVVGFEMPISRLEGKRKLSQNRSVADRDGVVAGLRAGGDPVEGALAELMAGLRT